MHLNLRQACLTGSCIELIDHRLRTVNATDLSDIWKDCLRKNKFSATHRCSGQAEGLQMHVRRKPWSTRVVEHFDGRLRRLLNPHPTTIILKATIDLACQLLDPWLSKYLLDMGAEGAFWAIPHPSGGSAKPASHSQCLRSIFPKSPEVKVAIIMGFITLVKRVQSDTRDCLLRGHPVTQLTTVIKKGFGLHHR